MPCPVLPPVPYWRKGFVLFVKVADTCLCRRVGMGAKVGIPVAFCSGTADKCLPVFRLTKPFEFLELSASVVVGLRDESICFSFVVVLHLLHVLTCMRIMYALEIFALR